MKTARKALLALLMTAVILCLSGCVNQSNEVEFFEDGSVAVTTCQYYAQAYMDYLGQSPTEFFAEQMSEGDKLFAKVVDGNTYWALESSVEPQVYSNVDEMIKALNSQGSLTGAWEVSKEEPFKGSFMIVFKKTVNSKEAAADENGQPADNPLVDVYIDEIKITTPNGIAHVRGLEESDYTITDNRTVYAVLHHKDTEYTADIGVWQPTVLTGTVIYNADLTIKGFENGKTPADVTASLLTDAEGAVDPENVKLFWYEFDEADEIDDPAAWTVLEEDDKFDFSKYLIFSLNADINEGYSISIDCGASLNGKEVEEGGFWNSDTIGFSYVFEPTMEPVKVTPVKSVEVTVEEPVIGKTMKEIGGKVVTDPAGAFGEAQFVWSRTTKKDAGAGDWEQMAYDDKFEAGYYYACDVMAPINEGFEAKDDTPATVNGEKFVPPFGIQVFHDDTYGEDDPYMFVVTEHFEPLTAPVEEPKELTTPFIDVPKDAYYYDATVWAFNAKPQITDGNGKDKFMPEQICSRGQVVTFLWRSAGQPAPAKSENPFEDVKKDDYFYEPVLWAFYNDTQITDGTDPTHFSPGSPCRNSHILTFIYRAMGEPGKTGEGTWYTDAYNWANYKGLLKGTYEGTYDINAQCPRKNVVQYLYTYYTMSSVK